jgi:serine/threonine protein kinase
LRCKARYNEVNVELSRLGRYELVTRIGQGGMAEVQLAVQRGPAGFEKLVVIKLINERLAAQKTFVDMLLDEARVAALVKHPNVVDIYDLGEVDGRYYIAMEYLEGEPLLALLRAGREGTRLDPLSTCRLIADTAEGLDAAHELRSLAGEPLGLVHHDVSLGNIVVLYNGQVKLVDFGVARATQVAGPAMRVHGKVSYMAPEKLRGKAGDRRSDIWSLGVVLWEALTLRRLFRATDERETLQMVLDYKIPLPSTVNSEVPVDADAIVMRALERDPEKRYQSAKDLSDDLEALLANHHYGRQNKIATYMQQTFGAHIAARRNLMREVSTKGTVSSDVIDAVFFDEKHSIPGELSIRFKRNTASTPVSGTARGSARRSIVTEVPVAEGTPIQDVEEIVQRRKRNSFAGVAEGTPHSQVTPLPVEPPPVGYDTEPVAVITDSPRSDTVVDQPAYVEPDEPVEQATTTLDQAMLDNLVRKSQRIQTVPVPAIRESQRLETPVERPSGHHIVRVPTPAEIEIDRAISEVIEAQAPPDAEVEPILPAPIVDEAPERPASRVILLGAAVGIAAILGFLAVHYL